MPAFLMDYAFLAREGEEKSLTILVCKDADTKVIQASTVMTKGRGHAESVAQAAACLGQLGRTGRLIIKVDGEPALEDLRTGLVEHISQ